MSYLTPDQANQIDQAFDKLHDFFAQKSKFLYFKENEVTVITEDPNFNAFAPSFDNTSIEKTVESGNLNARIYYNRGDFEAIQNLTNGSFESQASFPVGWLKIIVKSGQREVLEDTQKIIFEDRSFQRESPRASHGLLSRNFSIYYFKPIT
jgi:hypothetical protein